MLFKIIIYLTMSNLYKITDDPKKFGKGMWLSIHVLAYHAKDKDVQINYCSIINTLCSNIPCHTCRNHAMEFIKSNPPQKMIDINNPKAMFEWSCKLHNNANNITGAPMLNWELIYKEYEKNAPVENKKVDLFIKEQSPKQKVNEDIYTRIINNIHKK